MAWACGLELVVYKVGRLESVVTWLKSEILGLGKGLMVSWALFVGLLCFLFSAEDQTWPSVC